MGYIVKTGCDGSKTLRIKLYTCLTIGSIFLMIAGLSLIRDPVIAMAKYLARVDYGTATIEALTKESDAIHLEVYLFNVTNAEAFASGEEEKLKVQEVGPFTYQENRTNEDIEIDHEAGVMRYTPRQKMRFLPEESIGDPKKVVLTLPNVAMLATASKVANYGYLGTIGFNVLAARLRSNVTVTLNVHDYLWGYDEPLIRLGNQYLPGMIPFEKLGLLDRLYDKKETMRMEVSSRDYDKFMIKSADKIGGLKQWGYENPETKTQCNSFTDSYEGLCYPPELTPSRRIRIYRSILCRLLDLDYQGFITTDIGVKALRYKVSNTTYRDIPENHCLCSEGVCYDGISDLSPCIYGLPVVLSHSHFLYTNPNIYSKIEGLNPNEAQHGSEIIIESTIGLALKTSFSVQINVMMRDVSFNSKLKKFSDMIVPVGYFKVVQPKLTKEAIDVLRLIHVTAPKVLIGIQVVLITVGLFLLSYSATILYWNWDNSRKRGIQLSLQTKDVIEASDKLIEKS